MSVQEKRDEKMDGINSLAEKLLRSVGFLHRPVPGARHHRQPRILREAVIFERQLTHQKHRSAIRFHFAGVLAGRAKALLMNLRRVRRHNR